MAAVVAEQAVVADFGEARRQDVQPQAADELEAGQGHVLEAVGIGVILVSEANRAGGGVEGAQASVGDGHAVGVASLKGSVNENVILSIANDRVVGLAICSAEQYKKIR